MGIMSTISGALVQTAVYWAPLTKNAYAEYSYAAGVEVRCRWENAKELVINNNGEEVVSRARVWLDQDVVEDGFLYLGSVTDSVYDVDPGNVDQAERILAFTKTPRFKSTTEFLRRANVNMTANRTI